MIQNEGEVDRVIRVVLGVVIILATYSVASGVWVYLGYILGLLLTVTGLSGFCAIYKLFGVSTKK